MSIIELIGIWFEPEVEKLPDPRPELSSARRRSHIASLAGVSAIDLVPFAAARASDRNLHVPSFHDRIAERAKDGLISAFVVETHFMSSGPLDRMGD